MTRNATIRRPMAARGDRRAPPPASPPKKASARSASCIPSEKSQDIHCRRAVMTAHETDAERVRTRSANSASQTKDQLASPRSRRQLVEKASTPTISTISSPTSRRDRGKERNSPLLCSSGWTAPPAQPELRRSGAKKTAAQRARIPPARKLTDARATSAAGTELLHYRGRFGPRIRQQARDLEPRPSLRCAARS